MHALLEKLRALPEPVLGEGAEEIDYAELEVGEEGADLLCELLLADGIPAGLDEEGWLRIRVHAWRALGVRGEMQFFALFLALLRNAVLDGDDYYCEEFVSLMVCLGDEAVPPLLALLFDSREGEELRANVAMALDALAEREEVRETITGEYARFLAQKGPSRLLNGFIVGSLIDLDAVEHVEVIRELFEENLVNVAINGDMEQVEIRLGIRESRSSERPDFMELEKTLAHQARRDELGAPPETEDPLKVLSYFLALHGTVRSFRSVSMLDGFLLACVCAPDPVMPSRYMPLIWDMEGDPELGPVWDSMDEAQLFHEALMNLQNAGVEAMQTATFAPVALLEDFGNGPKERFHDWALGALTGMSLWDLRNQQIEDLKEKLTAELLEVIRRESENEDAKEGVGIPPLRRAVALLQGAYGQHKEDFLSAQSAGRALSFTGGDPYQREVPKIGRNDPCPCGSGKKYKKCCMG